MSDEKIRVFVASKISWIKMHQLKFAGQQSKPEMQYNSGEKIYIWGKEHELIIEYSNKNHPISVAHNTFILTVKSESTTKQREKLVNEWYRDELKKVIPSMLATWQSRMGVEAKEFRIKNMKTRWGTCNTIEKRIWLNLQLAKSPIECLEYVVVHELTHLLERLHSKNFIAYMDNFLPNWRKTKKELNSLTFNG